MIEGDDRTIKSDIHSLYTLEETAKKRVKPKEGDTVIKGEDSEYAEADWSIPWAVAKLGAKSKEGLEEELCEYCSLDEEGRGVQSSPGSSFPVFCGESRECEEAYENYLGEVNLMGEQEKKIMCDNCEKSLMEKLGTTTGTKEVLFKCPRCGYRNLKSKKEVKEMKESILTDYEIKENTLSYYEVLAIDKETEEVLIERKVIAKDVAMAEGKAGLTTKLDVYNYDRSKLAIRVKNLMDIKLLTEEE